MINTIKEFKKEAINISFFSSWNIISENEENIVFQKIEEGKKPSCLIGFILLCIFIIPGILYLTLGGKNQKTRTLTISKIDNNLIARGDSTGVVYANAVISEKSKEMISGIETKENIKKIIILTIILLPIIIAFAISQVNGSK